MYGRDELLLLLLYTFNIIEQAQLFFLLRISVMNVLDFIWKRFAWLSSSNIVFHLSHNSWLRLYFHSLTSYPKNNFNILSAKFLIG